MTTPARKQYLTIKAEHPNALLMYQVGDFFEFFDEDAQVAAQALQIVLTSRSYGPDERIPLAGVPVHARDTYAARLVAQGHRVAICEQIEVPARGLVRREVTRVLTPGTVTEPGIASADRDNYLVAVCHSPPGQRLAAGLAFVEPSTGEFKCVEWHGDQAPEALATELDRLGPAEVLVCEATDLRPTDLDSSHDQTARLPFHVTPCPPHYFERTSAHRRLCRHFATPSLHAFGCEDAPLAASAAGAILAYLEHTNAALLSLVANLQRYSSDSFVQLDGRTWAALEILAPAHPETKSPTVLTTIDATRTLMGGRLLRRLLMQPLLDRAALEARLNSVAALHSNAPLRQLLGRYLDGLPDLERLASRVVRGTAEPKDLIALGASLQRLAADTAELASGADPSIAEPLRDLDLCPDVRAAIEQALCLADQGHDRLFRCGYDAELDALIEGVAASRGWIARLESSERVRTGIKSLKVTYNTVFGYSIEVTRPNLDKVPADYQRRQTLAHGERYVTFELREHEAQVLHAEERIAARERALYADLLRALAAHRDRLMRTARTLAQLDVWLGLAEVAVIRSYARPTLTDGTELDIRAGRHPVVEAALKDREFIANDTRLNAATDADEPRMLLLTGPNMAGKSTYLRQVAQIVLLAQIGSFVPARSATIGITDRIFARVGADDDLTRGVSTFMREMSETAFILRHATARSLIILDEVGRGTSTRDGQALAQAVLEHVHERVGARTLFATHFHDLADLRHSLSRLEIAAMDVEERDGSVVFLHRLRPGSVGRSYGIQVAKMAGVPEPVTQRATALLSEASHIALAESSTLREGDSDGASAGVASNIRASAPGERIENAGAGPLSLPMSAREVILALAACNIAAVTPIEAINLLFSLQQRAAASLRHLNV